MDTPSWSAAGPGTEDWDARLRLAVWCYDSAMGAAAGYVRLRELQRRGGVRVMDAITVTWVRGTHRPRIGHLRAPRPVVGHAPPYSVLGALADVVTLRPGVHDPIPTLAELTHDTGIDESVLQDLRAGIRPGRSVLLVLADGADPEQVRATIQRGLDRGDVTMSLAVLTPDAVPVLRQAIELVLLATTRPPPAV